MEPVALYPDATDGRYSAATTSVTETTADHDDLLTQHPALPVDMSRLRAKFTDAKDNAWVVRMSRGELVLTESWFDWLVATPVRTCVAAAVLWWIGHEISTF